MFWLALHLPLLSLEAFSATLALAAASAGEGAGTAPGPITPDGAPRPIALVAEHRIAAANAAARELGVQPGQKRATALALAPALLIGQADAVRDAQALQAVVHVALAFTPSVTLEGSDCVLLEVQASLRYFGGLPALRQRLFSALAPLGHTVHGAGAPTALGAALLARWRCEPSHLTGRSPHAADLPALQSRLDAAPLALLAAAQGHAEALQGMGLHTLADLRRLPRAGLARRFGAGLLDELDRALGRQADPRLWLTLPAMFESRLELFARADSTEQVLQGAAVLLARLLVWAQAQQARIGAFTLRMLHEPRRRRDRGGPGPQDATHTDLDIALADPSADADHLRLLLRERLANLVLAAPTLELRLHCSQLVRAAPPNGELFPTRQGEREGLTRLLERLRARLGDDQVQQLQPLADHRPERATGRRPAQGAGSALSATGAGPMSRSRASSTAATAATVAPASPAPAPPPAPPPLPLHRPVWLLPEPQPLHERRSLPLLDGQPLQLLSGPERIEAGWWDGALAARDYFIAQAADGALVWIYRARLPRDGPHNEPLNGPLNGPPTEGWFLQGRFG